jgi:hypothetical protein
LEYERWLYWGEIHKPKLAFSKSEMPDLRDDRDPEMVGLAYLDNKLVGNGP